MGVRTTADDKISEATDNIKAAIKAFKEVLDEETWGHETYSDDYIHMIEMALIDLLSIKRKL